MKSAAAIVLGLAATACSHDFDSTTSSIDQQAIDNAQASLGFYIPENQDWVMSSEATTNITVNGDYDETYEVFVYQNNPFINNEGTVLASGTVKSGGTLQTSFRHITGITSVCAAIKDKNGYTYVKPAAIIDGKLNVTFGHRETASSKTRSFTRGSAADDFVIPTRTMPDLSTYINDAVAITDENNTENSTVHHFLIPEGTTWSKNIPTLQSGSDVSVYVQGTLNINAEQRVNGGCVFIVGPKGTVNIASGTQLVTNANNAANTVGSFYVYRGGTVEGAGTLQFANGTGSYNYNGGKIDVGTLNNNGGELYNAGEIEADYLAGGAGGSLYVNAGKVHIKEADHGSQTANLRIINNCWWYVDETIACRNIVQGVGAYFRANNLEMSGSEDSQSTLKQACVYLKDNSLIDIPGAVAFNNVDIIGPTGENYAFLQFGYAETAYGAHGLSTAMNYSGGWGSVVSVGAIQNNIYLSIDHSDVDDNIYTETPYEKLVLLLNGAFCGANEGNSNYEYNHTNKVGNGHAELINKGEVTTAASSESDCSPGVTINPPTEITNTKQIWSYAFEDSNLKSDYDMNDVVIKVQESMDGTTLTIWLVAAGCEYDNEVYLDEQKISWNGKSEVHEALGALPGQLVNTNRGVTKSIVKTTIAKPEGYNPQTADWSIVPSGGDMKDKHIHIAKTGENPCGIVIPMDWKWPAERVSIVNAYAKVIDGVDHSFASWAKTGDHTDTTATDWFNNPSGSVVYISLP